MSPMAGDPGSCSHLGGALRTSAARLAERSADLAGPSRRRVQEVAALLDDAGARLQRHAQELAELTASARCLSARCFPQVQADRDAARLRRSRAQLARHLHQAGEALDHLASETPSDPSTPVRGIN